MKHSFAILLDHKPDTLPSVAVSGGKSYRKRTTDLGIEILQSLGYTGEAYYDQSKHALTVYVETESLNFNDLTKNLLLFLPYFQISRIEVRFRNALLPTLNGQKFQDGTYVYTGCGVEYAVRSNEAEKTVIVYFTPQLIEEIEKESKDFEAFLLRLQFSLNLTKQVQNLLSALENSNDGYKDKTLRKLYSLLGKNGLGFD